MGGGLILISIAISTLLWADLGNRFVWITLGVLVVFGAVGWVDDWRKVIEEPARPAGPLEVFLAVRGRARRRPGAVLDRAEPAGNQLIVPFFKTVAISMGWFYVVLTYFVINGTSNAVNLTDGLDGLAIMPTVLVAAALGIFAYASGHAEFATYLQIPYIAGAGGWW